MRGGSRELGLMGTNPAEGLWCGPRTGYGAAPRLAARQRAGSITIQSRARCPPGCNGEAGEIPARCRHCEWRVALYVAQALWSPTLGDDGTRRASRSHHDPRVRRPTPRSPLSVIHFGLRRLTMHSFTMHRDLEVVGRAGTKHAQRSLRQVIPSNLNRAEPAR